MSDNASFVNALKEALNGLKTIHAVGEEWCSYIGKIPTGGVPYCGQEVQRETYSALWSYAQAQGLVKSESEWQSIYLAQSGNVPFYSSGNGSSTFRVPRLVGYVRGASGPSEAGSYVKEGLPNITGSIKSDPDYGIVDNGDKATCLTGAFVGGDKVPNGLSGSTEVFGAVVNFDASQSNQIYGSSIHVTPETSCVLFGVFAFGEISNVDSLDVSSLASAFASLEVNTDAHIRVVESWRSGRSWYRKYNDGWIEQGGDALFAASLGSGKSDYITVSLNTPFTTLDYTVVNTSNRTNCYSFEDDPSPYNYAGRTLNSFRLGFRNVNYESTSSGDKRAFWYACGY